MRARLLLGSAWVLVGTVLVAVLVRQADRFEPGAPVAVAEVKTRSPLVGMVFDPDTRRANLEALGLTPGEVGRALDAMRPLDIAKDQVGAWLDRDPATTSYAMCDYDLPVLYRASRLLLRGTGGPPVVVDLRGRPDGGAWAEFPDDRLLDLLDRYERSPELRRQDTLIGLAALITGKAAEATRPVPPDHWRTVASGGGWDVVKRALPGTDTLMIDYLAAAMVAASIVDADPARYGCAAAAPPDEAAQEAP